MAIFTVDWEDWYNAVIQREKWDNCEDLIEEPTLYLLDLLDKYHVKDAFDHIFVVKIKELDEKIQKAEPWKTKDKKVISGFVSELGQIAFNLEPFAPETSKKILDSIKENKKPDNIFPRQNV